MVLLSKNWRLHSASSIVLMRVVTCLLRFTREVTEAEASARLSAASHSLLARNLCTINQRGHPVLDSALERTLLPLFKFDRFYQISVVIGETQTNVTVHVRLRDSFTARTVQAGVVHILDTRPIALAG